MFSFKNNFQKFDFCDRDNGTGNTPGPVLKAY